MTHWGSRIAEARHMSGLMMRAFGERVGTDHESIRRWELGREPLVSRALCVSRHLSRTVDQMVGPDPLPDEAIVFEAQSERILRGDTRWAEAMIALANEAGSRSELARLLLLSKPTVQSWARVRDRIEPTVELAWGVAIAIAVPLHTILTIGVAAPETAVARLRARLSAATLAG